MFFPAQGPCYNLRNRQGPAIGLFNQSYGGGNAFTCGTRMAEVVPDNVRYPAPNHYGRLDKEARRTMPGEAPSFTIRERLGPLASNKGKLRVPRHQTPAPSLLHADGLASGRDTPSFSFGTAPPSPLLSRRTARAAPHHRSGIPPATRGHDGIDQMWTTSVPAPLRDHQHTPRLPSPLESAPWGPFPGFLEFPEFLWVGAVAEQCASPAQGSRRR